jgi:chromosome segregation ATPase
MMRGEEAAVLAGITMGIVVLDLELQTSPEVLDTASDELDLSLYLKDGNYLRPATEEDPEVEASRYSEESFNVLSDQNATLRALNERLQKQAAEAEAQRTAALEAAAERNAKATAALDEVEALRARTAAAEARAAEVEAQCKSKLEAAQADMSTERSTYNESRVGLNDMFDALSKQLETEKNAREEMEADLARAREARTAAEAAVERAEANDQARQSTIEGLRKQLREVKNLNLRTLGNLQVRGGRGERGIHHMKGGDDGGRCCQRSSPVRDAESRALTPVAAQQL